VLLGLRVVRSYVQYDQELVALPAPDSEKMMAIYEKSSKEQSAGVLGPWTSKSQMDAKYGVNGWRAMKRFAVFQAGSNSWRCIDNGLTSGHNGAVTMWERIHTTSSCVGFSVAKRLVELEKANGGRIPRIFRATRDMKSAYRQCPRWEGHANVHIICAYHPELQQWMFAELCGLAFGISIAVILFNRIPSFITAVARRWLAIPAIHFFDDFKLTATSKTRKFVWKNFNALVDILGWIFDPDKDSTMSEAGPFLGFMEDYASIPSQGVIYFSTKQVFRENLLAMMEKALGTGRLSTGEARSLQGKILHQAEGYDGRIGRGQAFAFADHIRQDSPKMSPQLVNNIIFHKLLCEAAPVRRVDLLLKQRRRITVYTDASCEIIPPRVKPTVKLCYLILCDTGYKAGGYCTVPDSILDSFQGRETYIAQGEALAPLLAMCREPSAFYSSSAVMFIDNMGVLASLCKGSSVVADFGCVVHAFLLAAAKLNARPWFEHVDSKANPADGGTRDSLETAHQLGIDLREVPVPEWPVDTVNATPYEWLAWVNRYIT
jgi:hypothetical protein